MPKRYKCCGNPDPFPDLCNWVLRCMNCKRSLRFIEEAEGNAHFNAMTGLGSNELCPSVEVKTNGAQGNQNR